ncbi:hypothetical protein ACFVT2_36835 [Streptomyces sp. NPDC058000]|uniref:hypothetical protein n=1 Tax=Streptomyces sp. NPDC058000 TaxID=3346299 RepID=UPI0036E274D3
MMRSTVSCRALSAAMTLSMPPDRRSSGRYHSRSWPSPNLLGQGQAPAEALLAADRLLRAMLERLVEAGLLKAGGRQLTDATHVLALFVRQAVSCARLAR